MDPAAFAAIVATDTEVHVQARATPLYSTTVSGYAAQLAKTPVTRSAAEPHRAYRYHINALLHISNLRGVEHHHFDAYRMPVLRPDVKVEEVINLHVNNLGKYIQHVAAAIVELKLHQAAHVDILKGYHSEANSSLAYYSKLQAQLQAEALGGKKSKQPCVVQRDTWRHTYNLPDTLMAQDWEYDASFYADLLTRAMYDEQCLTAICQHPLMAKIRTLQHKNQLDISIYAYMDIDGFAHGCANGDYQRYFDTHRTYDEAVQHLIMDYLHHVMDQHPDDSKFVDMVVELAAEYMWARALLRLMVQHKYAVPRNNLYKFVFAAQSSLEVDREVMGYLNAKAARANVKANEQYAKDAALHYACGNSFAYSHRQIPFMQGNLVLETVLRKLFNKQNPAVGDIGVNYLTESKLAEIKALIREKYADVGEAEEAFNNSYAYIVLCHTMFLNITVGTAVYVTGINSNKCLQVAAALLPFAANLQVMIVSVGEKLAELQRWEYIYELCHQVHTSVDLRELVYRYNR